MYMYSFDSALIFLFIYKLVVTHTNTNIYI